MNRHPTVDPHTGAVTPKGCWLERECVQAFYAMRRAIGDGRWLDAVTDGIRAQTLREAGHGTSLPPSCHTELDATIDALTAGDGATPTPIDEEVLP